MNSYKKKFTAFKDSSNTNNNSDKLNAKEKKNFKRGEKNIHQMSERSSLFHRLAFIGIRQAMKTVVGISCAAFASGYMLVMRCRG